MSTKSPFTKEFGYVRLGFILGAGSHNFPEIIETFGDIEKINALTYNEWAESKLLKPAQLKKATFVRLIFVVNVIPSLLVSKS